MDRPLRRLLWSGALAGDDKGISKLAEKVGIHCDNLGSRVRQTSSIPSTFGRALVAQEVVRPNLLIYPAPVCIKTRCLDALQHFKTCIYLQPKLASKHKTKDDLLRLFFLYNLRSVHCKLNRLSATSRNDDSRSLVACKHPIHDGTSLLDLTQLHAVPGRTDSRCRIVLGKVQSKLKRPEVDVRLHW